MEPEIYARIKPLDYKYKNCLTKNDKELILSLPVKLRILIFKF